MDDVRCSSCGRSNPPDASFCNGCAQAISAPERHATIREERRQVTVLFSDVSGYTTMAEDMDPEALRELMSAVYERAGAIIEGYGGRVDKLMGDAVLAVFGDPVAHEDDAERAIRAALDMHAAVQELAPALRARTGRAVEMHSGINSGIIVASDHARDRASGPLGDMVNVAARLQAAASAGEIVVGADTIDLLGGTFALRELGVLELKGRRDGVRAALVEGVASGTAAPSRRSSTFVGRNEELGILLDAVENLRDGRSSVVSICAEAGAGKSRLLEELRSRLDDDVIWIEGRAFAYTTNIPYSPIIDLLNQVAGITEDDDSASVLRKLESLVEEVSPGDDSAIRVIRQLYGASDSGIDLEAFRGELAGALSRLVEAAAARAPTIVCFQDLHWVDPSTAALVRDLLAVSNQPRVTICNFRPGFELGVPGARHFELSELSPRQTREQLVSLLEGGDPPSELLELVVERADGNPFFAEEIVNSLIDRKALIRDGDTWTLVEGTDAASVPSTIRALLESRIDSLDPQRKRVLREASVVGREFLHRVIESIASEPDDLRGNLDELSAADLIRRAGGSEDADLEYIFKHALTQEVAYEGLLRSERQILHGRVARSIEQQFGDRNTEMVETLAYHYQRSGIVAEAVKYLRLAGAKALAQYSMTEAHHHYQSAHELLVDAEAATAPLDPVTRDVLVMETVLEWCHAFYYTGEFSRLGSLFEQHAALPGRVGDPSLRARWRAWEGMVTWTARAAIDDALAILDDAYALATECGDDTARGYAAAWLTWVCWMHGRCSRSIALWEDVSSFVHRIPDPYDQRYVTLKSMGGAATAAALSGRIGEAISLAKELQAIGDSTGNRRATALAHCVMVCVEYVLGNADDFAEQADLAVAARADPIYAQYANTWYVGGHLGFGDIDRAVARHDEAGHLPAEVGNLLMASQGDMYTAEIDILHGRLRRGSKHLDASRTERADLGDSFAVVTADAFLAMTSARIATKEADGSVTAVLLNPGFAKRHVVGAARKGRQRLEDLASFVDANEYNAVQASIEFELGKLAQATKRHDDARGHFERVLTVLDGFPEAGYYRQASERLSQLAELRRAR